MPNTTPNYNLTKPLETENYDVNIVNNNSDKIDTALKANADAIAQLDTDKVDAVVGKQLSDENYTLPEKNKVANLPDDTNAQLAEKAPQATTYTKTENDTALALKANKAQEAFELLSVINGATLPYALDLFQARKNDFGEVELRGRVGIASNIVFTTLPLKYRPAKTIYFICHAANNTVAYGRILQTGEIQFLSGGNTTWVSLDNVKFTAGV